MSSEKTSLVPPEKAPPAYSGGPSAPDTIIVQQPVVAVPPPYEARPTNPELGVAALTFAVISTFFVSFFGCFWALPCTLVGIVFGVIASATGSSGDLAAARSQFQTSIICTVAGWISVVVGVVIIVAVVLGVIFATPQD